MRKHFQIICGNVKTIFVPEFPLRLRHVTEINQLNFFSHPNPQRKSKAGPGFRLRGGEWKPKKITFPIFQFFMGCCRTVVDGFSTGEREKVS